MVDDLDVSEYVRRHQAALAAKFREPDTSAFAEHYGAQLPTQLSNLYAFREILMKTPIRIATSRGSLFVQSFVPLSSESVNQGRQYLWRFFAFAVDDEGELLLFSLEQPRLIYVDHSGDGSDIEETGVEFESVIAALGNGTVHY